jgi:hypothetical protein
MLEFYYDFIDVLVDHRDFQYCAMDTDSAYMALFAASLEEVIKPEMQQRYQLEKKNWFPVNNRKTVKTVMTLTWYRHF